MTSITVEFPYSYNITTIQLILLYLPWQFRCLSTRNLNWIFKGPNDAKERVLWSTQNWRENTIFLIEIFDNTFVL